MKILVLGASGMAGHVVTLYLKEKGYDVFSFTRKPISFCDGLVDNILSDGLLRLKNYITENEFHIVVNCIGILNSACDINISEAIFINSYLPHFLADALNCTGIKLIHLSTDCVFSGDRGKYGEKDLTDGRSYYDRTKALGELNDNFNLTFRNSIIGPDMNEGGIGLFNWYMKQEGEIYGYSNVIWNGVTTLVLAQAIDHAIKENIGGIYHLVNSKYISKYNLLKLFNRYFKNNEITIKEKKDIFGDKSLINNRSDFSFQVPPYPIMIKDMKDWIRCHHSLYPHYKIEG